MFTSCRTLRVVLAFGLAAVAARPETLTLSKAFVEKYKNAATITVNLRVDEALKKPHRIKSGGGDGDIHMAGRDDVIRLPLVVEIMNAAGQAASISDLKKVTGGAVGVTGVWRIWFEHLGQAPQVQGKAVPAPVTRRFRPAFGRPALRSASPAVRASTTTPNL